ncbi:hypothetical protein I316_07557 [Kwoniella heveanensis BCC8398]|uniref:Uncharacterized protein n=1 Tax=Kwoniella heveanensis BCC8398 TaxID=1296120 RepID=A0A1B9GID8_9TREE|nr:hypothetical protein I316_07557 [Kwoniella heveanensis BCC8398]
MTDSRDRDPLGSVSLNTPPTPSSSRTAHVKPEQLFSSSSSPIGSSTSASKPLAPVFLSSSSKKRCPQGQTPNVPACVEDVENQDPSSSLRYHGGSSSNGSPVSRKRVRMDHTLDLVREDSSSSTSTSTSGCMEIDENHATFDVVSATLGAGTGMSAGATKNHVRMHSIHDWFLPSTPLTYASVKDGKRPEVHPIHTREVIPPPNGVWRRGRKRLGVPAVNRGGLLDLTQQRLITQQDPYLSTLVTSLLPYHPLAPPSLILLPSLHPPTGRPRDFAPPLSVSFNNVAKYHDASSARSTGSRRLIAIAGEEGGVRILDVDEGMGSHREEKGFWWRAHGNAVFDLKWSADDTRVLTASGDQSTRLHALTTPTPTLLATLRGHTSSVKTAVFFDPSRSSNDPSNSCVVATGGRDGNILIYDIRCQGRRHRDSDSPCPSASSGPGSRRSSRERYADGVPGFAAQSSRGMELDPVMTIRGAHGDGRRSGSGRTATRSVTSLVALQSMPGVLASGGSFDGIVKLWDLRFAAPTARCSEPRPSCTSVGSLPDPTVHGTTPSRRARSINALCESPTTGDLYALCGDSRIHSLRPSYAVHANHEGGPTSREAIGHRTYTDPNLLVSSFYIRLAISPDGRYLSSGSCRGGVMTWDTKAPIGRDDRATRLGMGMGGVIWPEGKEREVCAVDWGKDMLAASADDLATRIWRSNRDAAGWLKENPAAANQEWVGAI